MSDGLKKLLKLKGKINQNLLLINLIFIFIFLNVWDFILSREFFNAMAMGIIMFGPVAFLWFSGNIRAAALLTLISLFEFVMMAVFVLEGFELSGGSYALKSVYWVPYLAMAGVNAFWGLKIYSENREKKPKSKVAYDTKGMV